MRLALIAALFLVACGGTRQPVRAPAPTAAAPPSSADAGEEAGTASVSPTAAAPVAAAVAKPPADTPICRQFRAIVATAEAHFAPLAKPDAATLPGASTCTVVGGDGPGQTHVTTYTCEYESAADSAVLSAKRDALEEQLRECGSTRALDSTRVRIARAGQTAVLVINVHDTARW